MDFHTELLLLIDEARKNKVESFPQDMYKFQYWSGRLVALLEIKKLWLKTKDQK